MVPMLDTQAKLDLLAVELLLCAAVLHLHIPRSSLPLVHRPTYVCHFAAWREARRRYLNSRHGFSQVARKLQTFAVHCEKLVQK